MKIDETGRIIQFAEKPKGKDLNAMVHAFTTPSLLNPITIFVYIFTYTTACFTFVWQQVDTSILGLSTEDTAKYSYIASMGVYVFKKDILLKLLTQSYPSCNDFGSEIIPFAVNEHNVQAR